MIFSKNSTNFSYMFRRFFVIFVTRPREKRELETFCRRKMCLGNQVGNAAGERWTLEIFIVEKNNAFR